MSSLHQLAVAIAIVLASPLSGTLQEGETIQGDWVLNRELTPPAPGPDDQARQPEGRRPPGGGGGVPGGGVGFPGGGGGGGGRGGGPRPEGRTGPGEKEMRAMEAVRGRIQEAPQRLVISIDGTRVQLVDELGRITNLVADGKKQDRLTGDGEFRSITRIEGGRLVVEEQFDGPKVTTTYERLNVEGASRLQVTLQVDGMPQGRGGRSAPNAKVPITRVYDSRS